MKPQKEFANNGGKDRSFQVLINRIIYQFDLVNDMKVNFFARPIQLNLHIRTGCFQLQIVRLLSNVKLDCFRQQMMKMCFMNGVI